MDRLEAMRIFAAVAEAGSFAAASRRLRVSPPAATRAVAALEARLGIRLLNRTTRRVSLTEPGARFLDTARRVFAELDAAEKSAAGAAAEPVGLLTLTAPLAFGRLYVAPVVSAFLTAHPGVTARLLLVDRVVDLVEEGIDAALRIGALPDSSLQARRLGEVRRQVVAAPEYLRRRGTPRHPRDLAGHDVIAFGGVGGSNEWRFGAGRQRVSVKLAPRLELNDAAAAIALAEHGDGVTRVLSYQAAASLAARRLVAVLERFAPASLPVQLVHPAGRFLPAKTRAFLDFAAPLLRRALGTPGGVA
jgi:DNA-binding transcriptional LysR family regulator